MLSFFRRNLFINLIFLFLFACLLQAYMFIEWTPGMISLSIGVGPEDLLPVFSNHYFQSILTILLLLTQAILASRFVINHKMSRALSYIPGAVFILFASLVLENFSFHSVLLANLFFILAAGNIYNIYKEYHPVSYIFNAGFFLAVASLIYYPYISMFPVLLMGLVSLRSVRITEILQLIIGFLCPYLLCWVGLFATGNTAMMEEMVNDFSLPVIIYVWSEAWIKPSLTLLLIIVLLFFHRAVEKKRTFDAIRKINLNYWFLLFGLFSLLFTEEYKPQHIIILSLPISLLAGLIFERKTYILTKEFIFMIILVFYFMLVFQII